MGNILNIFKRNKEDLIFIETWTEKYYIDSQGRKQGEYKGFSPNGNILIKCNYDDDKLNRKCIDYYTNTDIISTESNYSKGLLHGEYIGYYGLKRKWFEGNFVNGKKEEKWIHYKNDDENTEKEYKYYQDGVECDPPSNSN